MLDHRTTRTVGRVPIEYSLPEASMDHGQFTGTVRDVLRTMGRCRVDANRCA